MAKNKTQERSQNVAKNKKNFKQKNICKLKNTKKTLKNTVVRTKYKQKSVLNDVGQSSESNNVSVLELMTKYPELNETFEYILYSNKYKHTVTDVFNIVKMLMSKLEELQKNEVDHTNIFETMNMNNKIKGLVQSTAINLSHVVEQLNTNESKFLKFASNFETPLEIPNDFKNETENIPSSCTSEPIVSEESKEESAVSSSVLNFQNTSKEKKTATSFSNLSTDIFGCNNTIVLSSDDECEESNNCDGNQKRSFNRNKRIKEEDIESYVIGSDLTDILSEHNGNNTQDDMSFPQENQNITVPSIISQHLTPIQSTKVKKIKQKVPSEAVFEARKADFCLKRRLNHRNNEMLKVVRKLSLQPHEIVLEFDIVNNKPLVTIPKELAKVLKKHQVEGIRFLWNTVFETVNTSNTTHGTGCILAHRMGVGKTLQIVTLMYTILCHSIINIKTFLIICPPGLIYNWMDEIYKWLKDVDKSEIIKVYDLPKTNKLYNITNIATWKSKGGILILSYENFKSLVNCKQEDLREAFAHTLINPGPDVVILDEGHYIKNANTILLKSLTQIKTKRRIVLTGTPMQNSLKEYYTMVDFVKPNILGDFGDFSSMFIKPIDSGQFIDSSDESVQIMRQRSFILHRLLQNTVHRIDDANLKPLFTEKVEYTIEVNLTEFQCELYEKFLNYIKSSNDTCSVFLRLHVFTLITLHPLTLYRLIRYKNSKQSEFGSTTLGNKFVKDLLWIEDYGEDPRFFEANQSNKITYLMAAINECQKQNEKILCFVKSPLALDALEYFLHKDKNWTLGEDYLRMDGKTPLSIRNQMCEAFNNPHNPAKLFILSLGTGVLGYNMVGANRVLLLSTSWNPSNDLQAIYRCLRFGQKKVVYVNRLLARGTIEPKAYYRQISKLGMASSVVDLQHISRKVSYEQTNDLFTFNSSKQHYTLGPNTKDFVLNQLIKCNFGSISDLKEHDSMLVKSVEDQLTTTERHTTWLSFKNNELEVKSSILPKALNKVQYSERSKFKTKPQVINQNIQKESVNIPVSSSSPSINHELSSQNEFKGHGSKSYKRFNGPKSFISPTSTAKHTKFSDADKAENPGGLITEMKNTNLVKGKRNYWKNDVSIQNQFKSFQQKSFSHHKRYPGVQYRPPPFSGTHSKDTSDDQNESKAHVLHKNSTWYPNQQTSTYNNIHNRSGML